MNLTDEELVAAIKSRGPRFMGQVKVVLRQDARKTLDALVDQISLIVAKCRLVAKRTDVVFVGDYINNWDRVKVVADVEDDVTITTAIVEEIECKLREISGAVAKQNLAEFQKKDEHKKGALKLMSEIMKDAYPLIEQAEEIAREHGLVFSVPFAEHGEHTYYGNGGGWNRSDASC